MSDHARFGRGSRRFPLALLVVFLGALIAIVAATSQARGDEPAVPEDVAGYFATGLVPRLADLYGSPGSTDPASTFDETTKVGAIDRLLAWTPEFLSGQKTDAPTQLTNTWIAPVTANQGTILGLAAVWINPGNNKVELADFSRGRALVDALARAPKDTRLIDDTVQHAWFATDGTTLTPLVVGSSGARAPLTPAEYQKILLAKATPAQTPQQATNPGLLLSSITLGAVVVLLAVFILLPGRGGKGTSTADAVPTTRRNPRQEGDRAFVREASRTEARARVRARAAVSAEAGLVDAIAESEARTAAQGPTRLSAGAAAPLPAPRLVPPLEPAKPTKTTAATSATAKRPAATRTAEKPPVG
ncbi:hypothetical protein [Parafrigoribacterium soli]|uniref:hypothetical protein n=1 Tax=Parafrigoribacterium soli TaxID=3144663 RepID=UPI0032EBF70D